MASPLSSGNPAAVSASLTLEEQRGELEPPEFLPLFTIGAWSKPSSSCDVRPLLDNQGVLPAGTQRGSLSTILGKKKGKPERWKKTSIIGWMRQ